MPAGSEEEQEERPFAEIARAYREYQKLCRQIHREPGHRRRLERTASKHKKASVKAPATPEREVEKEEIVTPAQTSAKPIKATTEAGQLLREFVSPADDVFLVREEDWIGAVEQGLEDVPLCDEHGRYFEPVPTQTDGQTTLLVSAGQEYQQSLVPAVMLASVPRRSSGRGR